MSKHLAGCLFVGLVSACMAEVGEDPAIPNDGVALATEDLPPQEPSDEEFESCRLAESLDDGELAVRSCLLGAPVNAVGDVALASADESSALALGCNTYYGSCTGWWYGCSRATGEGWQFTACGSLLYAWMTICNGSPSAWSTGACLW